MSIQASFCARGEHQNSQMIGRTDTVNHRKRPGDDKSLSDSPSTAKRVRPNPPDSALLYHVAVSAHVASHVHLQQVFIPAAVSSEAADSPIVYTAEASGSKHHYRHDALAARKAMGLLLFSLDCLKAGLAMQDLAYAERLEFGIQFGLVSLAILHVAAHDPKGKRSEYQSIATNRIQDDLQDVLGALVSWPEQSG